ncbi:LAMI_0D06018g1_1 [Lachancea mirantina]|uniref:LAMI_0D06018g1_1 n=1 Tax=Lachancea mirantina TaxID=1230905 RepID=A0A1G4JBE3_9SACH|nr:LAMI_0D06018g1_1 [Lachancea mirantina]
MKVIKRRRVIKSCKYCYEHKLKCDKVKPCNNCVRLGVTHECIYGFNKKEYLSSVSPSRKTVQPKRSNPEEFKTTGYYPYFSNELGSKIASSSALEKKKGSTRRNAITKLERLSTKRLLPEEIYGLIPAKKNFNFILESYFQRINPIIPLLEREDVEVSLSVFFEKPDVANNEKHPKLLQLFTILFSVAYANVAEEQIPDLFLSEKYYSAFQTLVDWCQFPIKPSVELLRCLLIVNFVIDPNMVETLGLSAILLRQAQQLGLNFPKSDFDADGFHATSKAGFGLLWNYILFFEGSSSVVAGLAFMSAEDQPRPILLTENSSTNGNIAVPYARGRFLINDLYRPVMALKNGVCGASQSILDDIDSRLQKAYGKIEGLCSLIQKNEDEGEYFSSTLKIFLLRFQLRYMAITNQRPKEPSSPVHDAYKKGRFNKGILEVLTEGKAFEDKTVRLSFALLFFTLKRLLSGSCYKYAWYSKGSTVMQYLFVVIKDIFSFPKKGYHLQYYCEELKMFLSPDIKECLEADPVMYKYLLIEQLMKVLEIKLAPLWNDNDINAFSLVKKVKREIWSSEVVREFRDSHDEGRLLGCSIFKKALNHIDSIQSIDFEECLKQWEMDKAALNLEGILMNWISEV